MGRTLRVDFLARNVNLSAQKPPAGRLSGSKCELVCPKGPCGSTFWPKIQFCPPKRSLRVDVPAQNTILSAQKAPARRLSSPKYNFVLPKGPCGSTFLSKL